MNMTRRDMLLASVGLMVTGCAQRKAGVGDSPPRSTWHEPSFVPTAEPVLYQPPSTPMPAAQTKRVTGDPLNAIARSRWTRSAPNAGKVNSMNGVTRITVHHEGWKVFWSNDERATASQLEKVRRAHVKDRGWGDIGYHYIIDRAGRVWQGRPIRFQGAHVRDNNEHNLGVMLLGNFEKQSPTRQQVDRLGFALRILMRRYNVPVYRLKTHRELMPTACPGRRLQPTVARMRNSGYLG